MNTVIIICVILILIFWGYIGFLISSHKLSKNIIESMNSSNEMRQSFDIKKEVKEFVDDYKIEVKMNDLSRRVGVLESFLKLK